MHFKSEDTWYKIDHFGHGVRGAHTNPHHAKATLSHFTSVLCSLPGGLYRENICPSERPQVRSPSPFTATPQNPFFCVVFFLFEEIVLSSMCLERIETILDTIYIQFVLSLFQARHLHPDLWLLLSRFLYLILTWDPGVAVIFVCISVNPVKWTLLPCKTNPYPFTLGFSTVISPESSHPFPPSSCLFHFPDLAMFEL